MFIDSISFMPCSLRKLPEAFGLTVAKSWYPHYFNTKENMNYFGEIPDVPFYGADAMSAKERAEFLAWYESQRSVVCVNRNVLQAYCQDDVTVLREACTISDASLSKLAMSMSSQNLLHCFGLQ
jgi:hypothetical protein